MFLLLPAEIIIKAYRLYRDGLMPIGDCMDAGFRKTAWRHFSVPRQQVMESN